MQPYVLAKEKVYRTKIKTRMKLFSLKKTAKEVKANLSTSIRSRSKRLHTVFRSLKSRVVITFKTLKAMFQLFQAIEKLIKEQADAKEEIIDMKVRTSQLYVSFNYLYANIHEMSKEVGVTIPELDMNSLPTRSMLNL